MQKIEPAQFEDLFEQRLERYDDDRRIVSDEQEEQERISLELAEVNAAFVDARKGDSSTRERERALQSLENAFLKYKEIVSNLNVGRKFYNDLAKIVIRFRDECKDFRYQRRVEAGKLEALVWRPKAKNHANVVLETYQMQCLLLILLNKKICSSRNSGKHCAHNTA